MVKKILFITGILLALILSFYLGMTYNWLSTTEVHFEKEYTEIVVDEGEIVDNTIFLKPTDKYKALEEIDEPIRKTIALYMEANNLKLCSGKHRFNRVYGTLDEYLNAFKFEKIE